MEEKTAMTDVSKKAEAAEPKEAAPKAAATKPVAQAKSPSSKPVDTSKTPSAKPAQAAAPKKEEKKAEEKKRDIVLERVYVIPIVKAFAVAKSRRLDFAVKLVRKFASRHAKADAKKVRIAGEVNSAIRANAASGMGKRLKTRITKDKEGLVLVELSK